MRDLFRELRHGLRALRRRPAFTAAAILTLGLSVGLTTTIFGVVNGILLRPLPFPDAGRLVTLCEQHPGATPDWCSIAPPNIADIGERARSIEAIGFGRSWSVQLSTPGGTSTGIAGGIATPGMFRALGIVPAAGRTLEDNDLLGRPGEDRAGRVAVITHELWQSQFAGARDALGRTILLDGEPSLIVGIMPPEFRVPQFEFVQLWRPVHIDPRDEEHREWPGFVAYARLAPGVSLDAARAELAGITASLAREHFAETPNWGIRLITLHDLVVGGVRPTLMVFLGAVALVLLIGCVNVANLLLARAADRSRELSLRTALGAGRARLIRGLLLESLLLAAGGTLLGFLLATWGTEVFRSLAPPGTPRVEEVQVDARVLSFALAMAVVTTLLFGLLPALRATRVDLAQALRGSSHGLTARAGRLGRVLVVAELAVAMVLLAGAGLLTRTFAGMMRWQPGFEQEHLVTFSLFASTGTYATASDVGALWMRLGEELAAVPGVTAVGSASAGPLFGGRETFDVRDAELAGETGGSSVRWFDISPGYFAALGLPLLRGRELDERDARGAPPVAIVNEAMAGMLWPGENPIGKRVAVDRMETTFEVVGLARDVPPLRPGTPAGPEIYWSNRQFPRWATFFIVRTSTPPQRMIAAIRAQVQSVDPDLEPGSMATMPELLGRRLVRPRFDMTLLVVFGAAALALAAVGAYGLLAYVVAQRRREIGVRLALGARRGQIVRDVLRQGLRLALVGITLGVAGALALGGTIAHLVAGVSPRDPATLVASAAVLAAAAIVASLVPALRASRVDPMLTLRSE